LRKMPSVRMAAGTRKLSLRVLHRPLFRKHRR
jgi:hypothetical protein